MHCYQCSSTNIERGIVLGSGTYSCKDRLNYQTPTIDGVQPIYVDICLNCGRINQLHLQGIQKGSQIKPYKS